MGADAVVVRHSASGAPHRLAHAGWIAVRVVNAGDGTHEHPTQALLDAFTMRHAGPGRTSTGRGRDRRRRAAQPGGPLQRAAADDARRRGHPGRAADAAAGRRRHLAGRRRRTTSTRRCPRPTSVMMLRVQRERMNAAFFPSAREYSRRYGLDARRMATAAGPRDRDAPRPDEPRHGDHRRRRRLRRSVIVEQVANGVAVRMAVLYLLLGGTDRATADRRRGATAVTDYLIRARPILGGDADRHAASRTACIAESAPSARRRGRRGRSTPTGWSRCPAWSTCTPTCASRAARTPRRCETGTRAAALGGFTAVHAMANTDPVADTAGVVEQVWRLGREAGYCDVYPVGAVTVGLAGERLAELGAMADSAARVRVFSDDGKCVSDPVLMRRALEYVKAFDGVDRPARPGAAADRGRPDERGRAVRRLGLRRLARRRRGGDHRPRLPARRARRLAAARLPRVDGRLGRDRPLGQGRKGWNVTAEVTPHHLLLTDDLVATLRPDLQGQPAAAHRRRRRGAARRPGRRHDRRRRHRPRAAPARGQGVRVGGRGVRACSGWRRRCRSCSRRWSTPGCSTGPGSPTGCRRDRPGSAGWPTTAAPLDVGDAGQPRPWSTRAARTRRRPGRARRRCRATRPYAGLRAARPGRRDVPARATPTTVLGREGCR